jgi:O-acetyl-ADP-ribose deacetylase (regulator of RNase III)
MLSNEEYIALIEECVIELSSKKSICLDFSRNNLNSLITITKFVSEEVCEKMDKILAHETVRNSYMTCSDMLTTRRPVINFGISKMILYRGDVTKLAVSSIVNAANSEMLGCFSPGHKCVDNIIHCAAGPRLRNECTRIMNLQRRLANNGEVIITSAYALPCKYVVHTVGPIVSGDKPNKQNKIDLANCYTNSLELCKQNSIHQIAFTNISTGVFGYPTDDACKVAINAIESWLNSNSDYEMYVIFCTFTEDNYEEYYKYFKDNTDFDDNNNSTCQN